MEKTMENTIIKRYTPHIRVKDSVPKVMGDVIIALLPAILASAAVYGLYPLLVILTSVVSAVVTEFLFSAIFFKKYDSILNLSAVVTGILLALMLAPFTPLYVVAFGGAMAIIFGKLIYSGLGRNRFNPAIVGREFMTVFFSTVMASGTIGEYSVLLLVLGGVYLIYRDRISWHIPVTLFITVFVGMMISRFTGINAGISLGGLMLCGIYMATDMPTSSSTPHGKIYYGIMMGIVVFVFWVFKIRNEALSYAILVLNGFVPIINETFTPLMFGEDAEEVQGEKIGRGVVYAFAIIGVTILVSLIHHFGLVKYLVFIYIIYTTVMLIKSKEIQ